MNLVDKRVSVVGLKRSGSAVVSLLKRRGAFVFGSDTDKTLDVSSLDIPLELGRNTKRILDADLIVVSPGVSLNNPIIKAAKKEGIKIIGELELASYYIQSKIIAVTGTNGKTTTCLLIDSIMKAASVDSVVAGNIYPGTPLSLIVDKISPDTVVIVEVSSFQLETIEKFRPYIGVLLNVTPDHLDRHPSMEEYIKIKSRIFENQTEEDFAVMNYDDINIRNLQINTRSKRYNFSITEGPQMSVYTKNGFICFNDKQLMEIPAIDIPLEDILAAISVVGICGIKKNSIIEGLDSFKGAPHRMEHIGEVYKRTFINNSMCTNPSSFVKSLEVLTKRPILIMGGKSKMVDIEPILDSIVKEVKFCIVVGEVSKLIITSLKKKNYCDFYVAKEMKDAVRKAYSVSLPGDIVILSPGFASFDMFEDFEERGNTFKKEVDNLFEDW
ncbi:UDP-N-acetylmuramoyl-L-alanine--D-glutamate ligase [candidate division WOR-3 bacterium]|nr:UDP-N-acetylmuramoyl-L-alanine--D-glutamate ligase [candidate division WOR-3 bacterium]